MPHRTTRGGGDGPWLTSYAMYENCLRWLGDGATAAELEARCGLRTNVDGMRRWGYVTVEDDVLRPTAAGARARDVWAPLAAEIEARWLARHGEALSLPDVQDLPGCLPILRHGLFSGPVSPPSEHTTGLFAALSRTLLAFALAYEDGSQVISLALGANVLVRLGDEPVRIRDLPSLSGVSKEAIAMALAHLDRRGLTTTEARAVRLTEPGVRARTAHARRVAALEAHLPHVPGLDLTDAVQPVPGGWRTTAPTILPAYPMILHRGGYPDGA
jgi:hypothetical protein